MSSMNRRVRGALTALIAHCSNNKCIVLSRYAVREVCRLDSVREVIIDCGEVDCDVSENIVRETDLNRLVDVKHVDFIVPVP